MKNILQRIGHFLTTPYRAYRQYQDNAITGDYGDPYQNSASMGTIDVHQEELNYDSDHKKSADLPNLNKMI